MGGAPRSNASSMGLRCSEATVRIPPLADNSDAAICDPQSSRTISSYRTWIAKCTRDMDLARWTMRIKRSVDMKVHTTHHASTAHAHLAYCTGKCGDRLDHGKATGHQKKTPPNTKAAPQQGQVPAGLRLEISVFISDMLAEWQSEQQSPLWQ